MQKIIFPKSNKLKKYVKVAIGAALLSGFVLLAVPFVKLGLERLYMREAWETLEVMKTAQEAYLTQNGGDFSAIAKSADPWSLLGVKVPFKDSYHARPGIKESRYFTYIFESPNYVRAYRGRIKGITWYKFHYDLFIDLNGKQWPDSKQGTRLCDGKTDLGDRVCKSLSDGRKLSDGKWILKD